MKTMIKTLFIVGNLGVAALLTSCQTTTGSGSTAAVACAKCKTVWVNAGASGGRGNPIALKATGAMDCADCANIARPMLKGLTSTTHTCKSCGGSVFHCR